MCFLSDVGQAKTRSNLMDFSAARITFVIKSTDFFWPLHSNLSAPLTANCQLSPSPPRLNGSLSFRLVHQSTCFFFPAAHFPATERVRFHSRPVTKTRGLLSIDRWQINGCSKQVRAISPLLRLHSHADQYFHT